MTQVPSSSNTPSPAPKKGHSNPADLVQTLSRTMKEFNLSRVSYNDESFNITIESNIPAMSAHSMPAHMPMMHQPAPVYQGSAPVVPVAAVEIADQKFIKSPMIGTIYVSTSPGEKPLVKVGDKIVKGQDLFIIECMKTMNPVKAEEEGTVAEILVKNEQKIEYDQRLILLA